MTDKNSENLDLDSTKYDSLILSAELLQDAERSDLQSQTEAITIIK